MQIEVEMKTVFFIKQFDDGKKTLKSQTNATQTIKIMLFGDAIAAALISHNFLRKMFTTKTLFNLAFHKFN